VPDPPPVFAQVDSLALYALSSAGEAAAPGYWAGYRPSPSAGFGAEATLQQAWEDAGGVYLFLGAAPASSADFLAALDALRRALPAAARFLWIEDPNVPAGNWQLQLLQASSTGSGAQIAWAVSRRAYFAVGGYAYALAPGAALALADPGTLGYGVTVDAAAFFSPGGSWPAQAGSAWLPFAGGGVGAWAARLALAGGGTAPDDLARLGVELRYAYPSSSGIEGAVDALRMPVLRQDGAALELWLSLDPVNPLLPDRTALSFFSPQGDGSPPALASELVSTRGYAALLTPANAAAPLWPARLAFGWSPRFVTAEAGGGDPDHYLVPDGAFTLAAQGPALPPQGGVADRLSVGVSGTEYVGLAETSGTLLLFQAGKDAFAPGVRPGAPSLPRDDDAPPLTGLAATAYLSILPPQSGAAGLTYFAQPRQAPLFTVEGPLPPGFLDFHEMAAAALPSWESGGAVPAAVPVGVYGAIDPAMAETAALMEQAALAPARRALIGVPEGEVRVAPAAAASPGRLASAPPPSAPLAVTPQGLVAALTQDGAEWAGVVLANLPRAEQARLGLTAVGPDLRGALQSSEVFLVVSNVETFMGSSSVAYRLDPATLALLPAAGVPGPVVEALDTLLGPQGYPVYPTETAFVDAIDPVASEWVDEILPVAGLLKAELEGWTFQLSPRSWRGGADPTVMIFKFCGRTLAEKVDDAASWGWPQAAQDGEGSVRPTQAAVQKLFAAAAAAPPGSPYAAFLREVVRNPAWNGVLFLNAPVSISELPDGLQFLAAGIDTERFFAHHVGFSLTPFDAGGETLALGQTAAFGLVDYQDPADLVLSPGIPFAFKTLSLTARFANAALAGFSAQVELMVNRLFGSELTRLDTDRGNNLVLDGSYQRQNGAPSYAFVLLGENRFAAAAGALQSVEVLGVQLQTATGTGDAGTVTADFVLSGNLRFVELDRFDLFSWGAAAFAPPGEPPFDGYLRFGALVVRMRFPLSDPADQRFTSGEERISFDLGNSLARPRSLAANFPVRLTGFAAVTRIDPGGPPQGQTPTDLGYVSVSAPIDQVPLAPPWYGLVLTLELGTLGALAGSAGLAVTLLAAWAPAGVEGTRPVFLGLQLPGARSLGIDWPLEGVMRLGFRSFQFQASDESDGSRAYLLRMRRLALSILGWSFPPGNADVVLFGDPHGGGSQVVGWYAAYAGTRKKEGAGDALAAAGTGMPPAVAASPVSSRAPAGPAEAGPVPLLASGPPAAVRRRLRSGRRTPPPAGS